jgi:kinetochore protein Nuf2
MSSFASQIGRGGGAHKSGAPSSSAGPGKARKLARKAAAKKKKQKKDLYYAFPILSNAEIVSCLEGLDLEGVTEEKLAKPKPGLVKQVYECLAEYCMGVTHEEMNQAHFAGLAAGLDLVQNPELHDHSIPVVTYFRHVTKLMRAAQISDFSMLEDMVRPDGERFIRNISAVINFAKFREERLEAHNAMSVRTTELIEEKERQLEEQHQLEAEIEQAREAYAADRARIEAAESANTALKMKVEDAKNTYEAHKEALRDVQKRLQDAKEEAQTVAFQAATLQEENETLGAQIVSSPERIQGELRQMEEDLRRLRSGNTSDESRVAASTHRVGEVDKSTKQVEKRAEQMTGAIGEMLEYKQTKRALKETESGIQDSEGALKELETRQHVLERSLAVLGEKLSKAQRQRRKKATSGAAQLESARNAHADLLRKRNEVTAEQYQMQEKIKRVQAASEQVTGAFIQERDDALETYDQLQRSIEQYHDRMFSVAVEEEAADEADEADEENAEAGNRQAADTKTAQANDKKKKKKNVRMSTVGRRSYAAPAVNA